MDEFETVAVERGDMVPDQLRTLFNNPDSVRVQGLPCDLPELDSYFETSRPGVHIVGELAGMGLIKNALTQGQQALEAIAKAGVKRPGALESAEHLGGGRLRQPGEISQIATGQRTPLEQQGQRSGFVHPA